MANKHVEEQRRRVAVWAERVNNIENMEWPESFETDKDISKPNIRLTEFTKQWLYGIISADPKNRSVIPTSELLNGGFDSYERELAPNWWDIAVKRGGGKLISDGLPRAHYLKDKDNAYEVFMPAYKALKDKFDERPFWHWFTQHAQYTAERDSLKAVRGMIMVLSGHIKASSFENAYERYCDSIAVTEEEIEEINKANQAKAEAVKDVDKKPIGAEIEKDLKLDNSTKEPAITETQPQKELDKKI